MCQAAFFALQPRWTGGDRLFKLYITDTAVCGAHVAGQLYDTEAKSLALQAAGLFGYLFVPLARKSERGRLATVVQYDSLDPMSQAFLDHSRHNFRLFAHDIQQIVITTKSHWWTQPLLNSGSIMLLLMHGRRRRFILVGEQDQQTLYQALQHLTSNIMLKG